MDAYQKIKATRIIPVVKVNHPEKNASMLAKSLLQGGIPIAEVTFRTSGVDKTLKIIKETCPSMLLGTGTVTSVDQIKVTIDCGGEFVVTPGFDSELVEYALAHNLLIIPGCSSASDYHMATKFGLKVIKFFPAKQLGGVSMINALAAPFPDLEVIPTGGISISNLREYLLNAQVVACGGSFIATPNMIESGKWDDIISMCIRTREIISHL